MPEITPSRYLTTASWDDVPHLDEATKASMLRSTPPYMRAARSTGVPSLGAGAIYPIPPEEIWADPFKIPDYWPRVYALDVGWNRTAALWFAWDPSDGTCYPYSEYYRGEATPLVHAAAIKGRGAWIQGVIDPAARGRSQADGQRLIEQYRGQGLILHPAENAVESGIYNCWMGLQTDQIRPFKTLQNFWAEYRMYRRNEKGVIVKQNDHLMDDFRYGVNGAKSYARVVPAASQLTTSGHMVADTITGY